MQQGVAERVLKQKGEHIKHRLYFTERMVSVQTIFHNIWTKIRKQEAKADFCFDKRKTSCCLSPGGATLHKTDKRYVSNNRALKYAENYANSCNYLRDITMESSGLASFRKWKTEFLTYIADGAIVCYKGGVVVRQNMQIDSGILQIWTLSLPSLFHSRLKTYLFHKCFPS